MPPCSVCGREFPEAKVVKCSECGKAYCEECASEEPFMSALGICSDCEEFWEAEDDLEE